MTEPVREGDHARQFVIDRFAGGTEHYRTELTLNEPEWVSSFEIGKKYEYEISVYVPESHIDDVNEEMYFQWHGIPDLDLGEDYRNPVLSLSLVGNEWKIASVSDGNLVTTPETKQTMKYNVGIVQKGVWIDWKFKVKWSYSPDGYLQVWRDGVQVINEIHSTCYNDARGPYFKCGIYKWAWNPASGWYNPDPSIAYTEVVLDRILIKEIR